MLSNKQYMMLPKVSSSNKQFSFFLNYEKLQKRYAGKSLLFLNTVFRLFLTAQMAEWIERLPLQL